MQSNLFDTIDHIHSEYSLKAKTDRIVYLRGQHQHLNNLANQMALYVSRNGGRMTPEEKIQVKQLLDMICEVERDGQIATNELLDDVKKEIIKNFLRNQM